MSPIIDKLKQEHANFRSFLRLFDVELDKFKTGVSPDYELIDALLDFFTSFPDEWHHHKEDLVYDVLIQKAEGISDRLTDLRSEHKRLETGARAFSDRIAHLRRGSDLPMSEIVSAGETYGRLLRHHLVKEDQVFFPLAEQRLNDDDWRGIDLQISAQRESPAQIQKMDRIRHVEHTISEIAAE